MHVPLCLIYIVLGLELRVTEEGTRFGHLFLGGCSGKAGQSGLLGDGS